LPKLWNDDDDDDDDGKTKMFGWQQVWHTELATTPIYFSTVNFFF
jgi:hypothetical protein